ncbi:hypothetical protein DTW90_34420 [Neorhizobium sp. P12A]|uniref:hypothetical protein n=1 Tax=Neorhizobium sp. P12A TaxID=2268027 RepID=UPI0011F089DB|nr:hypothetical protein [Neorhizobium sp. P12A]KAA0685984.1 hypothetical protein DTW90_34420 [Neorhizobium sp. P12A]
MTDFENMDISLSADLMVGEGSDSDIEGAQLNCIVEERYSSPEGYEHMPFEEKLRLADVMIARWQRYRDLVVQERSVQAIEGDSYVFDSFANLQKMQPVEIRNPDGQVIWQPGRSFNLKDADGKIIGFGI